MWIDVVIQVTVWPIMLAPLWLPTIMWFMSPRAVRGLLIVLAVTWVAGMGFGIRHASDYDRYQWPASILWAEATWLLLVAGCARVGIGIRNWWLKNISS